MTLHARLEDDAALQVQPSPPPPPPTYTHALHMCMHESDPLCVQGRICSAAHIVAITCQDVKWTM